MKGYISNYQKAQNIAKAYGYSDTDKGYKNVVKQIFAKLLVKGRTIGKVNGKLVVG
tara:strand:+ start:260 stop:427 length:168 start_codon:yes stop_codon:yes gene_type:complete